ncbi:AAA-like domain-containing protein [Allocoleopsis sp.]|uniref:AAA-like domain-containing protein n=1 Tax=Allocoleopsis sp. TaxID=3088169 RepID=UPI002FD45D91
MKAEDALEFVEQLVYAKLGRHLNDLERKVFLGSYEGKTYEEIHPHNPEYVERYVGYKFWQKLSNVLEERVNKNRFKGALERAIKQQLSQDKVLETKQRVFISHWAQEPDLTLALQLGEALKAAKHQTFRATVGSMSREIPTLGEDWIAQIDAELQLCDYFLLLLSPQAAVSEMAIEKLRRVKELCGSRKNHKPVVLAIRVNCSLSAPLNHDLRNYLQGIGQCEWKSSADTPTLIQEILNLLADGESGTGAFGKRGEWNQSFSEEGKFGDRENVTPSASMALTSSSVALDSPPLPVAEPELPSGQVRLASAFYVERVPHEALCYKEILHPGALIRIKAPRQMGKTSLMARILYHAKEQGYRTVPLSFQHADAEVFSSLNQLLQWFCARITRKLRLPHKVEDYWTETFGSKDNCTDYFQDVLLSDSDSPLVLGLDEVDRVFQYPTIADDFFGLLRAWYEEAGYGDSNLWEKLRLVVVHSTEVYVPLNVNQSPFNVGLPIELPEFTREQVQDLTQRHGLNWTLAQVGQLMSIVGGHPYLVRVALYHMATGQLTLDQLLTIAPTEAGLYGDHLRRHLWHLQQNPDLAVAFTKVVTTHEPVELESVLAFKLHSLGLVQLQGNYVTPRFDLYRQYFRDRLLGDAVRKASPTAEDNPSGAT